MKPRPAPSISGDLGSTSFASLLWSFKQREVSGTLSLQGECHAGVSAGETLLTFERGALAQIRQPQPLDTLGCVLREQGAITSEQFDESLARLAAREGLQGDILLAMSACSEEVVVRALRAQLRRKAFRLFALERGNIEFYEGHDLLAGFGGSRRPADVVPLLWPGFRAYPEHLAVTSAMGRLGAKALRLLPEADLSGFGFDSAEVKAIEALRAGPATVMALIEAGCPAGAGRLLAALLLTTGLAEPSIEAARRVASGVQPVLRQRPPEPTRQISSTNLPMIRDVNGKPAVMPLAPPRVAQPVAPKAPAVDLRARLAAAEKQLAPMLDETYFQMLVVAGDAPAADVRAAHAAKVAPWGPEAAPEGALALREVHQQIHTLLDEALAVLTDEAARRRHVDEILQGLGTPNARRGQAAQLDAQAKLHAAEVGLRSGAFDGAIRAAREALAVNPELTGAVVVLVAALLAKEPPNGRCIEALGWVTRGLKLNPSDDRMNVLAGRVHARRGDAERAQEHFVHAYKLNATNMDAVRELRAIADRRRRGVPRTESAPGGAGLLAKLFGR